LEKKGNKLGKGEKTNNHEKKTIQYPFRRGEKKTDQFRKKKKDILTKKREKPVTKTI